MGSKDKAARLEQKSLFSKHLEDRVASLSARGVEGKDIAKDSGVRMIRARIRETDQRLRAIEALEVKAGEMAARKAEKLAAPKKEKTRKKEVAVDAGQSKRQQKKQQKKKEPKAK